MAAPSNFDPFDMWRQAINRLEENMNTMGTESLKSNEVIRALIQAGTVSTQLQSMMRKLMDQHFKAINLPTRDEVMNLAETLQRIESKLDLLLPAGEKSQIPRPSRTRQPARETANNTRPAQAAALEAAPAAESATTAAPASIRASGLRSMAAGTPRKKKT